MQAFSETGDPDFATGQPDVSNCAEAMQPTWAASASDQPASLTLTYPTPVLASQIDLYTLGQPGDLLRVEVRNSLSGLGRVIHDGGQAALSLPEALSDPSQGSCPAKLSLPVKVDFEVDLVIVTVAASPNPLQIDAVGLAGELLGLIEPPVFWRVPLPGTPVSLAVNQNGLVFAATEPDGLFTYDVEGNQLKQHSIPNGAQLTDVTADPFGNFVIIDDGYGWFILMSPEGEHLTIGGEYLYGQGAVSPADGNLYVLKDKSILVYTSDTAEFLREMAIDELPAYSSLAFDPAGRLFSLRNPQWQPELLQLDPQTGAELDAIPLARANQYPVEIVARDLAIDASGNFYVLFQMNTGQIAIHVLDSQGSFVSRFGRLTSDPDDWPEGAFFDARALAVSPDGRFVLVADGYDETSYLTAFLLEPEP
jgi:DNA-binding beta-propeller fold protein YncE